MDQFRDTRFDQSVSDATQAAVSVAPEDVQDRSIGSLLAEVRNLSAVQVEKILELQRTRSMRFGEAAIALGYVTKDDVLFALAQQFHYPYAPETHGKVSPELVALSHPFSQQSEAFRAVRSQLMSRVFADHSAARPALAVVSPETGDGKTFFVANLAVGLAQLGGRTLVVDADLRGPRQHQLFQVQNMVGLSDVLSGRREKQVIQPVSNVPGLFVLACGATPPNPLELLERPAFGLLLRELVQKFDYVLVDTPALRYGVDCIVAAARCGAAMMVARKDGGRIGALQSMLGTLQDSTTVLAGVVMNEY